MANKASIFEIINRILHIVGGLVATYGLWKFELTVIGIGLIALMSGHVTYLFGLILQERRERQKTGRRKIKRRIKFKRKGK